MCLWNKKYCVKSNLEDNWVMNFCSLLSICMCVHHLYPRSLSQCAWKKCWKLIVITCLPGLQFTPLTPRPCSRLWQWSQVRVWAMALFHPGCGVQSWCVSQKFCWSGEIIECGTLTLLFLTILTLTVLSSHEGMEKTSLAWGCVRWESM